MSKAEAYAYLPLLCDFEDKVAQIASRIIGADSSLSTYKSPYRGCDMIPILTPAGSLSLSDIRSSRQLLDWTKNAHQIPGLISLIEDHIFIHLDCTPRVMILKTSPGGEMPPHYDCIASEFGDHKPKLRVHLTGTKKGLWFYGRDKQKIIAEIVSPFYVMDGTRLHGLDNASDEVKYTLCLGSPWSGGGYIQDLIEKSKEKFLGSIIYRKDLFMEPILENFEQT